MIIGIAAAVPAAAGTALAVLPVALVAVRAVNAVKSTVAYSRATDEEEAERVRSALKGQLMPIRAAGQDLLVTPDEQVRLEVLTSSHEWEELGLLLRSIERRQTERASF